MIPKMEEKIKELEEVYIERYKALITQQMDKITLKNQ